MIINIINFIYVVLVCVCQKNILGPITMKINLLKSNTINIQLLNFYKYVYNLNYFFIYIEPVLYCTYPIQTYIFVQ